MSLQRGGEREGVVALASGEAAEALAARHRPHVAVDEVSALRLPEQLGDRAAVRQQHGEGGFGAGCAWRLGRVTPEIVLKTVQAYSKGRPLACTRLIRWAASKTNEIGSPAALVVDDRHHRLPGTLGVRRRQTSRLAAVMLVAGFTRNSRKTTDPKGGCRKRKVERVAAAPKRIGIETRN
jgi:hypothetical protein